MWSIWHRVWMILFNCTDKMAHASALLVHSLTDRWSSMKMVVHCLYKCYAVLLMNLTRTQKNLVLHKIPDSDRHLAQALLWQKWWVCEHEVKAVFKLHRQSQGLVIVVEHVVLTKHSEAIIKFKAERLHLSSFQLPNSFVSSWGADTHDPVQNDTHDTAQNDTHNPVQNDTHDPVQNYTHNPIQNDTHDPVQNDIKHLLHLYLYHNLSASNFKSVLKSHFLKQ